MGFEFATRPSGFGSDRCCFEPRVNDSIGVDWFEGENQVTQPKDASRSQESRHPLKGYRLPEVRQVMQSIPCVYEVSRLACMLNCPGFDGGCILWEDVVHVSIEAADA